MKKLLALFLVTIFALACARVSSPTGGPLDETPPTLIRTVPDSSQINYKGNTVLLEFDEWVKTNNLENNLIITPKIQGNYKTRVNKTTVLLTFDTPLADSTTYTLNFGNTIQDITNNNSPSNLRLSFSTGPYIDSLQISGKIIDLYTQEPKENTLVSLYPLSDTLDILSGPAPYFTRTDTAGHYTFTNLPTDEYLIYAVADKNNNLKGESDSESYGFLPDTLNLTENINNIDFTIQRLNTKPLRISSSRPYAKYFDITFSKAYTSFHIQPLNESDTVSYTSKDPTNIRLFNRTRTYGDSSRVIVSALDSIGNQITDTLTYYFIDSKIQPDKFTTRIEPRQNTIPAQSLLKFNFSKPVVTINPDSLQIQVDSVTYNPYVDSLFTWNANRTELHWSVDLDQYTEKGQGLNINVKRSAFISVEQDSSENFTKRITNASLEDTGTIGGSITTNAPNYIIQLLNPSDLSIIQEFKNQPTYEFSYLEAGSYYVRFIHDRNGNGIWDTGNILTKTPPEPIRYYFDGFNKTKSIKIKKNWELSDIDVTYIVDNL